MREPVSSDQDHWIRDERLGSNTWVNSVVIDAAPVCGGGVIGDTADVAFGGLGSPGWPELARRTRRTHWQDSGHENGTGDERTTEGALRVGRGNSSEESRPRGGGIGDAKARSSSDEGRGTLWTTTEARNRANLDGNDELARLSSDKGKLTTTGQN